MELVRKTEEYTQMEGSQGKHEKVLKSNSGKRHMQEGFRVKQEAGAQLQKNGGFKELKMEIP